MASVMPRQLSPHGYCGRYGAVITPHDGGWCCDGVSKSRKGEGLRGRVGLKFLGLAVCHWLASSWRLVGVEWEGTG